MHEASEATFARYVGELDQLLTDLIDALLGRSLDGELKPLGQYLGRFPDMRRKWNKDQLAKARVAVMTAIDVNRAAVVLEVAEDAVTDIEGRWRTILTTLAEKNIHVLPGGTIQDDCASNTETPPRTRYCSRTLPTEPASSR